MLRALFCRFSLFRTASRYPSLQWAASEHPRPYVGHGHIVPYCHCGCFPGRPRVPSGRVLPGASQKGCKGGRGRMSCQGANLSPATEWHWAKPCPILISTAPPLLEATDPSVITWYGCVLGVFTQAGRWPWCFQSGHPGRVEERPLRLCSAHIASHGTPISTLIPCPRPARLAGKPLTSLRPAGAG